MTAGIAAITGTASIRQSARGSRAEAFGRWGTRAALYLVVVVLAFILSLLVINAIPAADGHGLGSLTEFLLTDPWSPLGTPPRYGIGHALVSTLMVTVGSLVIATPLGFGVGLFASEIAPAWVRNILTPCLELLAGIPSVVYGFFGYVTLVAWFERYSTMATGESLLVAALVLSVMVLPFIASTACEAFSRVGPELKEVALSTGTTRWHVTRRILVPAAAPGLYAAIALGHARAVGETLAVLLLAGNSTAFPHSFMDRGQPLTALIATELPEAAVGTGKYQALFAAGLMLMVVTICINAVVWMLRRRVFRYGQPA
jgi:phosphate transport system permease protein